MEKKLPARPNLDHLRGQAKALLADLTDGRPEAIAIIREYLPVARKLTTAEVAETQFRLADAQSAVARKSGFAAWPHLARHVEQLRGLEGTWAFDQLEVDGKGMPAEMLKRSRLLIDGDRFRTESPEGNYEGVFNVNVEAQPHEIDIEFVEGPEAGNWNYGIFQLDGDQLELCLDLDGKPRPVTFKSTPGSGHAYEIVKRTLRTRPDNVIGGLPQAAKAKPPASASTGFDYVESATMAKLQGEWSAVKMVRDGKELPSAMLRTAVRSATKNEITISVGGRVVIHTLVKIDESFSPMRVDYHNIGGVAEGTVQHGLFKWDGDEACFCIAPPGEPRPDGV
jgi:uncharacterized protein (TIGR03067 family)